MALFNVVHMVKCDDASFEERQLSYEAGTQEQAVLYAILDGLQPIYVTEVREGVMTEEEACELGIC